jgi:hypothetical protein
LMEEREMPEKSIITALLSQADSCRELGSEFNARVLEVTARNFPNDGPVWQKMAAWQGDLGPSGESVPLRYAGALHAMVREGRDAALCTAYPPAAEALTDAGFWSVIEHAVSENTDFILDWLESAPQTNEVRRAGVLVPGFMEVVRRTGLHQFKLSELGASAGLNMIWDQYGYQFGEFRWGDRDAAIQFKPDFTGTAPPMQNIEVVDRAGCDLNPIDLEDDRMRMRLISYLWPDQQERIERTEKAIVLRRQTDFQIEKCDAIQWLEARLSKPSAGSVHVVYNTIAWQYFPQESQHMGYKLFEAAGGRATEEAPLAWLSFEADGKSPGAALTLTLWPAGEVITLARADFHGRWINWL